MVIGTKAGLLACLCLVAIASPATDLTAQTPNASPTTSASPPVRGDVWSLISIDNEPGAEYSVEDAWSKGLTVLGVRADGATSWTTTDGVDWVLADLPGAARFEAVALEHVGDKLVAVGWTASGLRSWVTETGSEWTAAAPIPGTDALTSEGCPLHVVGVAARTSELSLLADVCLEDPCCGQVAAGALGADKKAGRFRDPNGTWVWTSVDGESWKRARVRGLDGAALASLTVGDDRIYATARQEAATGWVYGLAMSSDGGRNWSMGAALPDELVGPEDAAIVAVGSEIVLVGPADSPSGEVATAAWYGSMDGPWSAVIPLGAVEVSNVDIMEAGIVGSGWDRGADSTSVALVVSQDGGRSWELRSGGRQTDGASFRQVEQMGSLLFAIGTQGFTGAAWLADAAALE